MSQGKFAPVTAALLARKGEARPWEHNGIATPIGFFSPRAVPPETPHEEHANDALPATSAFPLPGDGMRRVTLRLSQSDYERLGLIAAKRDVTRQRLLHCMLDEFLAGAAQEYARCECIGGACRHRSSG